MWLLGAWFYDLYCNNYLIFIPAPKNIALLLYFCHQLSYNIYKFSRCHSLYETMIKIARKDYFITQKRCQLVFLQSDHKDIWHDSVYLENVC